MSDAGVGWIAAIIIGGIAGWLAEQFMKSNMGLFMNIVLGIVGAAVASAVLGLLGDLCAGCTRLSAKPLIQCDYPHWRLVWRIGRSDKNRLASRPR
jgi:uncharacterized membrane protein YeaQ/YmgE (transglycosylase-associated protein family)